MPLNILWGHSVFDLLSRVGPKLVALWVLGAISFMVTAGFVSVWAWREHRACAKMLKVRPMRPVEVQLARTINFFPLPICGMAFCVLLVPSLAYSGELLIAITTCVIMAGLVQYIMLALGDGYSSNKLLNETPLKKWWLPSYCGGANDMLPGLGLVYSRTKHKLGIEDMRRSISLVEIFIWIFVTASVLMVSNSLIPMPVTKAEDGYCHTASVLPSGVSTSMLIFQVFSTFLGSAGFSIIAQAAHHAFVKLDEDGEYNFQKKAWAAFFFLQLPLLKVLLGFIPMSMPPDSFSIPVDVPETRQNLAGGKYTTSGEIVMCPVFDQEVCVPMLYNCLVTIAMAYLSYWQFRIYKPGQTFDELRESIKREYGEGPDPVLDSSEEDSYGSEEALN